MIAAEGIGEKYINLLKTTSLPSPKDEVWRKFPFRGFQPEEFTEVSPGENLASGDGWRILSWKDLNPDDTTFLETEIHRTIHTPYYFDLQNLKRLDGKSTLVLLVDKGAEVREPIMVTRDQLAAGAAYFPNLIIYMKNGSRAVIKEILGSQSNDSDQLQWINSFCFMHLGSESTLKFSTEELYSSNTYHFRNLYSVLENRAELVNQNFYLGGFRGKSIQRHYLRGEHSKLIGYGLSAFAGREFAESENIVYHQGNHSESQLLFKSVVREKSHHIFTGNLHISSGLKKIRASQVNHNLSLDKSARAESIPKLEIFSEDVQSSHGSTVGEIDEDQLFYLQSRGLSEDEARHILIDGFLSEIIDKISDSEEDSDHLRNILREKIWPSKS
jgi:Fe-S cluster assembly scaffold protein SufB